MTAKLIVWEVLCLALFYSVFCRSVRTSHTTKIDVRIAIFCMGVASLVGLGAPVYGWEPDWIVLMLLFSIVLMQIVTATHWVNKVPDDFVMSRFQRRRRRSGDAT